MRRKNFRRPNLPINYNNRNIQDAKVIDQTSFIEAVNKIEKDKLALYDSAVNSNDPELIQKAVGFFNNGNTQHVNGEKIKSMLVDPMDFAGSFGYKDRPTKLTYYTLRRMASTPFTALTINTRISQALKFCEPQPDEYTVGFKIRMRNRLKKPTKQNEKKIEELTNFILDGGYGGFKWGRDDFETYVSKMLRDSLSFDQYTFEILENRRGIPQEFIATDAATYRIAFPDGKNETKNDPLTGQKCYPNIAQIYQGGVENTFYPWELCFGIRRPRTDMEISGYGYAELEELVNIVTSMLYSDEYNRRFFSQGSAPKGLIRIASNAGISDTALKEFKRQWQMQMAGVFNSWKTPIMEADKLEWIDLSKSNRDMEFSQWQNYLIRIHSALFLIDPSEIGFDIQKGGGGGKALFESDQMNRIKYSRDKGLTPLLKSLQKNINKHLIWRIDPEYEFIFVGDDENEDSVLEKSIKELQNFKTLNEVRSKFDLKPISDDMGGNLILNSTLMSFVNNKMLSQQGQQQEEDQGQDFGDSQEDASYNPLTEDEDSDTEKALQENPFEKDLNDFVKGLK